MLRYPHTNSHQLAIARMLSMPRGPFAPILAVVSVLTIAPTARAEFPLSVCRYLGCHWGDGYHSGATAPPKRHTSYYQRGEVPASVPWWQIPAAGEELPYPGPSAASRPFPPSGPSLFRQPGDGSSVVRTTATPPVTANR